MTDLEIIWNRPPCSSLPSCYWSIGRPVLSIPRVTPGFDGRAAWTVEGIDAQLNIILTALRSPDAPRTRLFDQVEALIESTLGEQFN